jgi:hypothetical protein
VMQRLTMAVAVSPAAASPLAMPAWRIARMLSSCCWSVHGVGVRPGPCLQGGQARADVGRSQRGESREGLVLGFDATGQGQRRDEFLKLPLIAELACPEPFAEGGELGGVSAAAHGPDT